MSGTRISRDQVTPAMLARMSPEDRLRYAPILHPPVDPTDVFALGGRPTRPDYRPERDIQDDITRWLRGEGYQFLVQRMDRPSSGSRGWPDITFSTRTGKAVAMEVKNAKGKLSSWQVDRIAKMQAAGWIVEVVRSLQHAQDFVRSVEAVHRV